MAAPRREATTADRRASFTAAFNRPGTVPREVTSTVGGIVPADVVLVSETVAAPDLDRSPSRVPARADDAHRDAPPVDSGEADPAPIDLAQIDSAQIVTDGVGLRAVSPGARLDWLSPAVKAAVTVPVPSAEPSTDATRVSAWVASVRGAVAGVDLRSSRARRLMPQFGVVAVMAVATIGNAMSGHFSPAVGASSIAAGDVPREQTMILPGSSTGAAVASDLDDSGDLVAGADGVLRVRGAEEASRAASRDALPDCDGVPPERPVVNGAVPDEYLCTLPNGVDKLRADAAEAFARLNVAYTAHFGSGICISSGYRSFAQQAALRRQKPGLAARAGTSEHGNGLAVDMCGGIQSEGAGYWWLRENGPGYGFDNPAWARRGGSKFEPWHWEFVAGQW